MMTKEDIHEIVRLALTNNYYDVAGINSDSYFVNYFRLLTYLPEALE